MNYQRLFKLTLGHLVLFGLLSSCGVEGSEEGAIGNLDPYTVTSGTFDPETRSELRGSGTVAMSTVLPAGRSNNGFVLGVDLSQSGSKVTLVAHAPTLSLSPGISITFENSGGVAVDVTVQDGSGTTHNISSQFESFATPEFIVTIDIYNSAATPRILLWPDRTAVFEETAAYLDTTDDIMSGTTMSTGLATGATWGLIIENASVTYAQLHDPFLE